ncbi:ubiquinone biosynthesis protein Coq4 [Spinellus fusiger]|nr:ubiquinone biosynthesis protein Coq4 [Spinellus fusiger]
MFLQRTRTLLGLQRRLYSQGNTWSNPNPANGAKKLYESHIPVSRLQKAVIAVGSTVTAFRDPMRTDLIAALGETTGRRSLAHIRDKMLESEGGRRILKERPSIHSNTIDFESLRKTCAPNTFGACYLTWLDNHGLSADSRSPVKYVDDEELAYVMKRYREIHDFFHTLCNMGITVEEELVIKWLEWVQTGLPVAAIASIFAPLRMSLKQSRLLYTVYIPWAIQSAATSQPLMSVYFEDYFHVPIDEFRKEIRFTPPPCPITNGFTADIGKALAY